MLPTAFATSSINLNATVPVQFGLPSEQGFFMLDTTFHIVEAFYVRQARHPPVNDASCDLVKPQVSEESLLIEPSTSSHSYSSQSAPSIGKTGEDVPWAETSKVWTPEAEQQQIKFTW